MPFEEFAEIMLYILCALCAVALASEALNGNLTGSHYIEITLTLFAYHLFIRNRIYKAYFTSSNSSEKIEYPHPKDNPLPFIFYAILSIIISVVIMAFFGVHFSTHLQVALEILAIVVYQYFIIQMINRPSII